MTQTPTKQKPVPQIMSFQLVINISVQGQQNVFNAKKKKKN